ncbi:MULTISPECIES: hypothetical protein [Paenibacillus]|uniref:Flagellar protein FliT n=1 Tax=Paenibacillus radicis (ex Xue et al. 2023) TaxID=2972489 RepID=A0ABT1YIW2_9BACL|nr:hypothetical protein [Paenibacillus radicis (ex Xue et al. 2023)]MCR8633131.1 hypothetical protein [Paenibacillus radicis (ex Xue et al. 2023)]
MISSTSKQISLLWVDDYLDLYNYARKLGDTEWQQQILQTLSNKDTHIQHELQETLQYNLWRMFDMINGKMLEIYEQLRKSKDSSQIETLREQVWELRNQRVVISRRIKEIRI